MAVTVFILKEQALPPAAEKNLKTCGYAYGSVWAVSLRSMSRHPFKEKEAKELN